ncbi:MAG: YnbE family lipoprotein [Myxococcota bacterium]
MRRHAIATLAAAGSLVACTPTVNVAAPEPIVIQLNISHEVRLKIEEDVDGLIAEEAGAGQVQTRGVGDSPPLLAAKAEGRVGEQADGYVGAVPGHEADSAALLSSENTRRRAEYEAIAAERGTELRAVEFVAGERRIAEAEPGEWVLPADGEWQRKS